MCVCMTMTREMMEALPCEDKALLQVHRERLLHDELDQIRYAQSAAQMLRNNNLQNPYLLARAAAAVFSVVDVDESGQLDVGEVRYAK
jgi:protein-L-isoaspartate O-methyltransferase